MQGTGTYTLANKTGSTDIVSVFFIGSSACVVYEDTSNTPLPEIDLIEEEEEITPPKQVFERQPQTLQPKRRTVDKRARSLKFTQARVRR